MKLGVRFPIRYKLLLLCGCLLVLAVAVYTFLTAAIFEEEKVALLYEINHSVATNTAAQLKTAMILVGEQLRAIGMMSLFSEGTTSIIDSKELEKNHILAVQFWEKMDSNVYHEKSLGKGLPAARLQDQDLLPIVSELERDGYAFWRNANRFFLATVIQVKSGSTKKIYTIVGELGSTFFFRPLQMANLFESFLVGKEGDVLFHCDGSHILPAHSIAGHPLLLQAANRAGEVPSGVLSFQFQNQFWYGAYAPVGLSSLYYLSQANKNEVTQAIQKLISRSFLFGLIAVTIAFLGSILFSRQLVKNLEKLTLAARRIGKGALSSTVSIDSFDELKELADAFNSMAIELRKSWDTIEQHTHELEANVAKRTQELKSKNIELEEKNLTIRQANATIRQAQEDLLKSTQLSAVGEIAGQTAHELINPLTVISQRAERCISELKGSSEYLPLVQMREILGAWNTDLNEKGVARLAELLSRPSSIHPDTSLFKEDIDNLLGLAELIEKRQREVSEHFEFILEHAFRISRIANQMREFARSSTIKQQVHCYQILKETIVTQADFLSRLGIRLRGELIASNDHVYLNRDELLQIFLNLIRNSAQAIRAHLEPEKQRGWICLKTSNEGGSICIDVIDSGIGIPVANQSNLFERGFTTKDAAEGTGLGLAICRRYARAFGGDVSFLFSEPQTIGTGFRVTIPLVEEDGIKAA